MCKHFYDVAISLLNKTSVVTLHGKDKMLLEGAGQIA